MKTVAKVFKVFDKMTSELEKITEGMKVRISNNITKIEALRFKNVENRSELEAAQKGIDRINKFME